MFNEDLSVFFNEDEFAKLAYWQPSTGFEVLEAKVIKDSPDIDLFNNAVNTTDHSILYSSCDFPGLTEGETVKIEEETFLVTANPQQIEDGDLMRAMLQLIDGNDSLEVD